MRSTENLKDVVKYQTTIKKWQLTLRISLGMLLLCVFMTSCEDFFETSVKIDIPEQENRIVVHSFYENGVDTAFRFLITKTRGVLERSSAQDYLNDADIRLLINGAEASIIPEPVIDPSENRNAFNFRSENVQLEPGAKVELSVDHPDHREVFSSQNLPGLVVPDSAIFIPNAGLDSDGIRVSGIDIYFRDPPDIKNYYQISIFRIRDNQFSPSSVFISSIDPATTQYSSNILVDDEIFDGEYRRLRVQIRAWGTPNLETDTFEVQFSSITRDIYLYGRSIEQYFYSVDNPFTTPAQLYNNIENGIGIFSVSNTVTLIAE